MIPVFRPCIDIDAALANLREVFESGWLGEGAMVERFEQEIGRRIGAKHVVMTNSGTAALHLALQVQDDMTTGDRVLTTPITFVSTNAVLAYEELEPAFCDVEPMTGNISVKSIERTIKRSYPSALMVVHLGGYPCDMEAINEIADYYCVPVIEDCAHAFGASYKGKPIGSGNNLCCWSFHAVKNLPIGDAGAVSTQDDEIAARLRRLRWMGIDRSTHARSAEGYSWQYEIEELGYKYHSNDIAAAIGLVALRDFDAHQAVRRYIAETYMAIEPSRPAYQPDRQSAYHFLPLFFEDRDAVARKLAEQGIATSVHYRGNHHYPIFQHYPRDGNLEGARWYEEHELTLPIYPAMPDLERIVECVMACV